MLARYIAANISALPSVYRHRGIAVSPYAIPTISQLKSLNLEW
jgi:hypothetical protein